ncbi:ATP phosphoribosyltransferase [Filibacter tadaridae]|uniref:ATP phosphoribosyltransferase n=1 Tax=Filibacter tadaridae TaxID=2483811 RepID=A0A3P5XFL6_9BACL|nr:ATP phosphoribosyltransferase [Filibacter tadaridae]VDC33548.1 ATP phosphoribosyltransferase [Filibacter tadaridae]
MCAVTLALAKGRTADRMMELLAKAGIQFPDFHATCRKLVLNSEDGTIKLLFVKAVDVPTYVEKGAADIGIVGKDTIMEEQPNVYELLDFKVAKCQIVVAGFEGKQPEKDKVITVATKYPSIAERFFVEKGIRTELIKLNGSIELAPLIGMSDVIVDIVETGSTLKENGLVILETIADVSARLIVNKASFATKTIQIQQSIKSLKGVLE